MKAIVLEQLVIKMWSQSNRSPGFALRLTCVGMGLGQGDMLRGEFTPGKLPFAPFTTNSLP